MAGQFSRPSNARNGSVSLRFRMKDSLKARTPFAPGGKGGRGDAPAGLGAGFFHHTMDNPVTGTMQREEWGITFSHGTLLQNKSPCRVHLASHITMNGFHGAISTPILTLLAGGSKNDFILFSLLQISLFSHFLSLRILVNASCNGPPYQKYIHNSGIFRIVQK